MPMTPCSALRATACLFVCLSACSTSDRFGDDAGAAAEDSGMEPMRPMRDPGDPDEEENFGAACDSTSDCSRGLFCDEELEQSFAVSGLPGGERDLPSNVFPGGSCTRVPAGPYDPQGQTSCDPLLPQPLQGCGKDGVCVPLTIDGQTQVACRPMCDPSDPGSGCERTGYACDFDLHACIEGCQSDEECRLRLEDSDADGQADVLGYDDDSRAVCDTETFRCTHSVGSPGSTGAACERADDCDPDGLCVQPFQTFAGLQFPGGYCTKLGCELSGRECDGQDSTCERLRSWSPGIVTAPTCLTACSVGSEPEADRLGPEGHGAGCRPGYRCHYNGGAGTEGVCVGGEYNAVTESNIGASCEADSECYSPFGLAQCLVLRVGDITSPSGTCSLFDCAAPGLPDDLCGTGNECIGLNSDVTFCVQTCDAAEECPEGFACSDDDGDPSTRRICYPACFDDTECRKDGEVCEISPASGAGACN